GADGRRRAGVALAQRPPRRHPPRDGRQDRDGRLRRGGLAGEAGAEERVPRAVDGAVLCLSCAYGPRSWTGPTNWPRSAPSSCWTPRPTGRPAVRASTWTGTP